MQIRGISIQRDPLSIKLYLIMGLFSFIIPFGLVYWAEQFIASGLASILFGVFPFFVIIISRLAIPAEKIGPYKLVGVILGFLGIFIIFSENLALDIENDFYGMIAVVVSAIMQAGIAVTIKKYGQHLNPLSMNLMPLAIAGLVLTFAGYSLENSQNWIFDYKAVLSIIYLAFFGTLLTFTTYYWLMKKINIVILSLSAFITPIIAVLLGWIIAHETFTERDLIGSSLVLIGILFANFRGLLNYYRSKSKQFTV